MMLPNQRPCCQRAQETRTWVPAHRGPTGQALHNGRSERMKKATQRSVGARFALQSFRSRCSPGNVAVAAASSRSWLLVQSIKPVEVPPLLVLRSHFAVGHFLGCVWSSFAETAPITLSDQCALSSSFAFLQSSCPARNLVLPAEADQAPLMGFRSLQHSRDSEIHLPRALPSARYGPPAGFGYPLGGLRPPRPCRFCFTPAALLGFTLRSFLLTKGIRPRFRGDGPAYRFSRRLFPPPKRWARPNGPRFPGFDPSESPWRPIRGVSAPATGCSLGFRPFLGYPGERPGPGVSPGLLPSRFTR